MGFRSGKLVKPQVDADIGNLADDGIERRYLSGKFLEDGCGVVQAFASAQLPQEAALCP